MMIKQQLSKEIYDKGYEEGFSNAIMETNRIDKGEYLFDLFLAAKEIVDLLEDKNYKFDSFTLQPLKLAIGRIEDNVEDWDW